MNKKVVGYQFYVSNSFKNPNKNALKPAQTIH